MVYLLHDLVIVLVSSPHFDSYLDGNNNNGQTDDDNDDDEKCMSKDYYC